MNEFLIILLVLIIAGAIFAVKKLEKKNTPAIPLKPEEFAPPVKADPPKQAIPDDQRLHPAWKALHKTWVGLKLAGYDPEQPPPPEFGYTPPPKSDGGPTDSKEFDPKQNGRHHKVKLFSKNPVSFTLPAGSYTKVEFTAITTPTPEHAIQGPSPTISYRVTDSSGEKLNLTLGINAGGIEVNGPFTGNVVLTLETSDHIGWFIVQCQAH